MKHRTVPGTAVNLRAVLASAIHEAQQHRIPTLDVMVVPHTRGGTTSKVDQIDVSPVEVLNGPSAGLVSFDPMPSFDALLLAALPSLRRQALRFTRHGADAEDLVQEAVSSALGARNSFAMGSNFEAWVGRILRNHFFTSIRRRRQMVALEDAPVSCLTRSGGQEERIALQELQRHLSRLSPKQRQTLLMISIEGLSYGEMSARLGIAVGTLKTRVFSARTRLQFWELSETKKRSAAESAG